MKEYIFSELINKIENMSDINNIITFLDKLEEIPKNEQKKYIKIKKEAIIKEFLNELIEKYLFNKDEFFSNNMDIKILLLYKLYEKGKIKKNDENYYDNIINLLDEIWKEIDGNIQIKKLEEFLKNDESIIKQRLSLLKILNDTLKPGEVYENLKRQNEEINKCVRKLIYIKDNIIIYFKEKEKEVIKKLINLINNYKNIKISKFQGEQMKELLKDNSRLEELVDKIEKINNFLLFNVIYDMNLTKDEENSFNYAYNKLYEIGDFLRNNSSIIKLYSEFKDVFDIIKEKLGSNEERAQKFITDFIKYYNINYDNLIDELTILFKSKKYELDINSMIFFFDYFEKDNEDWNKKLNKKFLDLSQSNEFSEIKNKLIELKENKIYNYQNVKKYNKLFTCLYEKREAINFLFSKNIENIDKLKERIQPINRIINIKDIIDTKNCIIEINKIISLKDNNEIFKYIQSMHEETIDQFENYSNIYSSIIELDINDEDTENIYDQVYEIIQDASFNIYQDSEELLYYGKENKITMKELINLKNKIYIKNDDEKEDIEDEILKNKFQILIFFKNIISNLEIIYDNMTILRKKGNSLPIKINIKITVDNNEPIQKYYLYDKEITFEKIYDFLLKVKNTYISQLESLYKYKINLRFLYGKQFITFMNHIENDINIEPILRYILNNTNNNMPINEGNKEIIRKTNDWKNQFEIYNKNSLEFISDYITTLFQKNYITLNEHYNKMKLNNDYKGIFVHKCDYFSMEEFILNIFLDKMNLLPIAQNILIINKETSVEEIQSFLYRSILCNYNTLFVIAINNSFSDYQKNKMINYLEYLLKYKNQIYNKEKKKNCDKMNTQDYLDSCLIFVYERENQNIVSLFNGTIRYQTFQYDDKIFEDKGTNNENLKELENVKIITSDICGLGKSEKIKKEIMDNKKQYYHFPLGGTLSKSIIYNKLENLMEKIKTENYKDVAIHLDLTESSDREIINEFLFCFLITKFYKNNENIIYIPKDIFLYIEIPNCYEDYLSKFRILNIFNKEKITFKNIPSFNLPVKTTDILKRALGFDSNIKIEEFVKNNIGIKNYSYHQINVFIKIFISQYCKFGTKIKFFDDKKDVSDKVIKQFASCTQYFTYRKFSELLVDYDNNSNNNKDYIDLFSDLYDSDLNRDFEIPLNFVIKEKKIYKMLYIPTNTSKDYKNYNDYLKRIKEVLDLPNEVEKDLEDKKSLISILKEKDDDYIIINDTFKKMALLIYQIMANLPVIIMGETGVGKTTLIVKLNQILNNGQTKVEIININTKITDEILSQIMKEKNEIAEKQKDEELWIFFDDMNTCLSMSLLTEIFINRTFNGNKLNDNIRLIGACNPYRKIKSNKDKFGSNYLENNHYYNELIYLVQPLPQSLLYYVFSWGYINDIDEKEYIYNIIGKLFTEKEKYLQEITTDIISQCHIYLRNIFDSSIVSLRDIVRFVKLFEFFKNYFTKKNYYLNQNNNENNNKLRSIICSIYLCHYSKLTDHQKRNDFELTLRPFLLQLINNGKIIKDQDINLIDQINNGDLKNEILFRNEEIIKKFSDFLIIEQEFIFSQIELNNGVDKNTLLKENIFSIFISIITNIPLIIIGKPGSGKSLSAELISKSMKGKYSKSKFFQLYPKIIQVYFQGSESCSIEDVEILFKKAENKLNHFKNKNGEIPIIMILFDNLELTEKSKENPLEILYSKLEILQKKKGISFIGISNYLLEESKLNKTLVRSVPDFDKNFSEILLTSYNIVESISEKLKDEKIFRILSRTYYDYKNELEFINELIVYKQYRKKIEIKINNSKEHNNIEHDLISDFQSVEEKEIALFESIKNEKEFQDMLKQENKIRKDFHGYLDFYNLIKGIATELGKYRYINDSDKVEIIEKYIERNFGGIEYKIDIDFDLSFDDIIERVKTLKEILKNYDLYHEKKIFKTNSVFLFKHLYNKECENKKSNYNLKINKSKLNDYNINDCINNNINDVNSRYLLLEVNSYLSPLIYQNIIMQNPFKEIIFYEGSTLIDDNNRKYRINIINKVKDDAKDDKLIVLKNLEQIHPFLYDLYNRNYIIKNGNKYVRIFFDNYNDQLALVNDNFRVIVLTDKNNIYKCESSFLNRFEKLIVSLGNFLDNKLKNMAQNLIDDFNLKNIVRKCKNINYSLKDLFINCNDEDIQGLIYYFSQELKNYNEEYLRDKLINKIYKILPQDIIYILPKRNIIKRKYIEFKKIYNFKEYIKEEENLKYKISIIYTFTSIATNIESLNKEMSFMASEIKREDGLKITIEELKKKNEYTKIKNEYYIYIHFDKFGAKHIEFISNYILNNCKNDKYNYIFIIHINRNFSVEREEKILSLPDINSDINQIFIDNLNYNNNIRFNDLINKDIKNILEEKKEELKLNDEFNKTLKNFFDKKLNEKDLYYDNKEYINEILNYFNEEVSIKEKIIEIIFKLIEDNEDESNVTDIIENIYKNNFININTFDITTCLIEYIKEIIFDDYLKNIFEILENKIIFIIIYENIKNNFKKITKNQLEENLLKDLDNITTNENYITLFKKLYETKPLNLDDKVTIYKFSEDDKNNINFIKKIIKDFIILLKYLNTKRKEKEKDNIIKEEAKIYEIINEIKYSFYDDFIKLFEKNDSLTIDKTFNIFDFYLKTIYEIIKDELKNYNEELDETSKKVINNYLQKKDCINKKDISYTIRLFSTLELFQGKNKVNKKKYNDNLFDYLDYSDLWAKGIYDNPNFNKNLNELKLCNIKINQIITLYEFFGKDIEENYFDDVKKIMRNNISEKEKSSEEEEDDDSDDNSGTNKSFQEDE